MEGQVREGIDTKYGMGENSRRGKGGGSGRNRRKEAGYRLFAAAYRLLRLLPVKRNQVFSIMTHDASETGNVRMLERYMAGRSVTPSYRFYHLDRSGRQGVRTALGKAISFFLKKPYQMARAEYILMDNAFLPMAYFRVRKETGVVQLWHGTGTVKKFGQDSNTGWLREKERLLNRNITHLIVNASSLTEQYARAFAVPKERVFATGLPRTDAILRQMSEDNNVFLKLNPDLINKKMLLYAPTFRDQEGKHPKLHLDVKKLSRLLPQDYVLLLRLHPFVAAAFEREHAQELMEPGIRLVSDYPDLAELMKLSCGLITDYSSIIFEYCLLDRPMYFYADDLEEFSDSGRGFYEPYEQFVPGTVYGSEEELAVAILTGSGNGPEQREKRTRFQARFYDRPDGNATKRVYEQIRK